MNDITGVGIKRTYVYNGTTKRLSMKNGEADDTFVKFFNGEIDTKSKEASTLNVLT